MSDRELLEAAAKAHGFINDATSDDTSFGLHLDEAGEQFYVTSNDGWRMWNPLTDDGDALRLAVKLNLDVDICFSAVGVCYAFTNTAGDEDADNVMEQVGSDPYAATRRAIVRAASELGRDKGETA